MAWDNEKRNHTHTREHRALRRWALANLDYVCAVPGCGTRKGLHLDHVENIKGGGTHSNTNVQWLCPPHHKPKIQREAARARRKIRAMAKFPEEKHPGMR